MKSEKTKYKEATSFFGVERMEKLESAIKEQSQRTKAAQKRSQFFWHLKLGGAISLILYSVCATAFIINNELIASKSSLTDNQIIPQENQTPVISSNAIVKVNPPKPETKLTVKKGDSLSTIAQRIIKTNGVKNTYENRQVVISELKNKNSNLKENQLIKYGWTILSLSQNEVQQICKN